MKINKILDYLTQIEQLNFITNLIQKYNGKNIPATFFKELKKTNPHLEGYCDYAGIEFVFKKKSIFSKSFIGSTIYTCNRFNFPAFKQAMDEYIQGLYQKVEQLRLA